MNRIKCFFLTPTDQVEMYLRRYTYIAQGECVASGLGHYHNATVVIGRGLANACPRLHEGSPVHGDHWPHDDPRWPAQCACGYTFRPDDAWQFNPDDLYRRSDNGELVTIQNAPVGAMWDAAWLDADERGPDGLCLCVKTPACEWLIDGPAYPSGQQAILHAWTRTGAPPDVTANPSIHIPGRYHGWLRNGWLEEC